MGTSLEGLLGKLNLSTFDAIRGLYNSIGISPKKKKFMLIGSGLALITYLWGSHYVDAKKIDIPSEIASRTVIRKVIRPDLIDIKFHSRDSTTEDNRHKFLDAHIIDLEIFGARYREDKEFKDYIPPIKDGFRYEPEKDLAYEKEAITKKATFNSMEERLEKFEKIILMEDRQVSYFQILLIGNAYEGKKVFQACLSYKSKILPGRKALICSNEYKVEFIGNEKPYVEDVSAKISWNHLQVSLSKYNEEIFGGKLKIVDAKKQKVLESKTIRTSNCLSRDFNSIECSIDDMFFYNFNEQHLGKSIYLVAEKGRNKIFESKPFVITTNVREEPIQLVLR